jgi:IS30 family transposase
VVVDARAAPPLLQKAREAVPRRFAVRLHRPRAGRGRHGTEFAGHAALLESLGILTYFADPHGSWQRGSNKNRNGMIRRYLPKGTPITMDMNDEIQMIVAEINNRPMRTLGYRTPAEAWTDELLESTPPTTLLHL